MEETWERWMVGVAVLGLCACGARGFNENDRFQPLNDAQIVNALQTLNRDEIAQAQAAQPKLTSPDAQAFAARMITEHTAGLDQLTALNIKPQDTSAAQSLRLKSEQLVQEFNQQQPGAAFDALYIDSQVAGHQTALGVIDAMKMNLTELKGSAQVGAILDQMRAEVSDHLVSAQQLAERVGQTGTDGGTTATR